MDNEKEQLADAAAAEQSADTAAASGGSGVDMKLDFKRTLFVGFAFMGIMCFWEVYDYIMPLILQRVFGMEFKRRQEPQPLYVSDKPFGRSWTVPLVGHFNLP